MPKTALSFTLSENDEKGGAIIHHMHKYKKNLDLPTKKQRGAPIFYMIKDHVCVACQICKIPRKSVENSQKILRN